MILIQTHKNSTKNSTKISTKILKILQKILQKFLQKFYKNSTKILPYFENSKNSLKFSKILKF